MKNRPARGFLIVAIVPVWSLDCSPLLVTNSKPDSLSGTSFCTKAIIIPTLQRRMLSQHGPEDPKRIRGRAYSVT